MMTTAMLLVAGYRVVFVLVQQARTSLLEHADMARSSKLDLALNADAAFGWRLIVVASLLLAYLVGLATPGLRRPMWAGKYWIGTLGWVISGFLWIIYAALGSMLGINGDDRIAVVWLVGPVFIAGLCFVQGSAAGTMRRLGILGGRRLAALFAVGFLILFFSNLATSGPTNAAIRNVFDAFGSSDVQKAFLETFKGLGLPPAFWLVTPEGNPILVTLMALTLWLVLSYAYGVTTKTPDDLPAFFRCCPFYPPVLRRVMPWLIARRDIAYAWLPGLVVLWPIVVGELAGHRGASAEALAQILTFSPGFLALLVAAGGWAWTLGSSQWDQRVLDTSQRAELLRRTRFSLWLLYVAGGLIVGNLIIWAETQSLAVAADVSKGVVKIAPGAVSAPVIWSFAGVVLAAIGLQYLLLVELPYWRGQRRWKATELVRTTAVAQAAEGALRSAAANDVDATDRSLLLARYALDQAQARYTLAQDERRKASEIPLHTFKSFSDLRSKLQNLAIIWVLTTLLGLGSPTVSKEVSDTLAAAINTLIH